MPDHKDYQSAMGKIAPSPTWTADTLAKLAAAQAGQSAPAAKTPRPPLRLAKRVGLPLAAAAAFALLCVPAALRAGLWRAGGTAPETAMAAAPESGAVVQSMFDAAAGIAPDTQQNTSGPAAAAKQRTARSFDLGQYQGLPVLVLGDDTQPFAAGSLLEATAEELAQSAGQSGRLPASLPVWYAGQDGGEGEQVGQYPLRSLEQAEAALQALLDAEQQSAGREYALTAQDIAAWRLDYAQTPENPYIQPVYVFYLKTPLAPADAGDTGEGEAARAVYACYTVSALPAEYCLTFDEAFG